MRSRRLAAIVVSAWLCLVAAQARAEAEIPPEPTSDAAASSPAPTSDVPALSDTPTSDAPAASDAPSSDAAVSLENFDPLYDEDSGEEPTEMVSDPLEPVNRAVFGFNESVDRFVLDPITRGYRFVVPAPARRGIERAFRNLKSPVVFANLVLQGRGRDAALTFGRFAANTTLGVGGVFDYADEVIGWERTDADFGQTLGAYGMPSGPYLMVPLFGPSNARDAVGTVADQVMNPLTYFVPTLQLQWTLLFGGGQGIAYREANADALDALRDASVDFYAALRSAYAQARQGVVEEAREARRER
jgi:phospholipid-binding lipoprotein MlaA